MAVSFRTAPSTMRMAIIYMVGQMEAMGLECSTADVAAFCKCTKLTARKHLQSMAATDTIKRVQNQYRKNSKRDTWTLSRRTAEALGLFASYKSAYDMVMSERMEMLSIPF